MVQECLPRSPFLHCTKANYFPSQLERVEIATLLRSYRDSLERLDAKRRKLLKVIHAYEELLSQPPIDSIPAEILQEIFQHCLPTHHLPTLSSSEAPISLTQVCRLWRNLALLSPKLWAAVHIPIPSSRSEANFRSAFDNRLAGATWWLTHARRWTYSPLTISLYWPQSLQYTFGKREDFSRAVIAASHNIRELDLDLPDDNLKLILNKPPTIFPRLEKITLRRGSDVEDACLWEAPSLRRVVWDGVSGDILQTRLKWDAMEEVRVEGTSDRSWFGYEDAMALLLATRRSIVKLDIQFADVNDDDNPRSYGATFTRATEGAWGDLPSDGLLSLTRLETLALETCTCQPHLLPRLYELLQLPVLRTLSYTNHRMVPYPDSQLEPNPLFTLLSGQKRPISITTFMIDASAICRATFFDCLKLMPSLERLWVMDCRSFEMEGTWPGEGVPMGDPDKEIDLDDEVLAGLLPTFSRPDVPVALSWDFNLLCPRLAHVRFDQARFTLDSLRSFIHTRLAVAAAFISTSSEDMASETTHVAKLETVRVGLFSQMTEGSNPAAFGCEFRESGVSVSVTSSIVHTGAGTALDAWKVTDSRDGLRPIDEWL